MATYPYQPGHRGVETSIQAARMLSGALGRLQLLVTAALVSAGTDGLTAHEAAALLRADKSAIQPRLSELRTMGLIRDSGKRRKNASGKNAIVWVLCHGAS